MVLIASLLAPLAPAWACSCPPISQPPCQAAWNYTAVFTGTVIDIAEPAPPQPQTAGPKSTRPSMYYDSKSRPPFSSHNRLVRIQIAEVLTGVDLGRRKSRSLLVSAAATAATRSNPVWTTSSTHTKIRKGVSETGICSRTRPLTQAAEDLAYLRAVPQLPPTADLRFSVPITAQARSRRPMPKVRTTISGPDRLREALTDSRGRATFAGLPPGEYTIRWAFEGYKSGNRKVQLHAQGCAEVTVYMMLIAGFWAAS